MNSNSTDRKQIRKFGIVAFIFFGLLCGLGVWKAKIIPILFFGSLSATGAGFIVFPIQLKPVYEKWLSIAHRIGKATTVVILTMAYYLVITPTAIIKRLFGGAPIPTKPDEEAVSYWVPRTEPIQPKERYVKKF